MCDSSYTLSFSHPLPVSQKFAHWVKHMFKLIANDELGSRCLKGLVGWGQMQQAEMRYPWQPWKREPPQERPVTGTIALNKFSGDTYLREYLPEKILMKPPGRQGGEREQESAMICKKAKVDALRSASKATVQCNTSKITHKEPCNSLRAAL